MIGLRFGASQPAITDCQVRSPCLVDNAEAVSACPQSSGNPAPGKYVYLGRLTDARCRQSLTGVLLAEV